jgi:RNA polymerase sigma-70 factor, ECF subfamily
MDENRWINECKDGNLNSFGGLYDVYNNKIYSYVYNRTHHKQTAEDITSTVFEKALERIETFSEKKGKFSSWLYAIARNSITDHYRNIVPTDNIESAWDIQDPTHIERDIDVSSRISEVKTMLSKMTKEQREIVLMRVWDEMSFKEISENLGKSEASCKMIFYRAVSKLKGWLVAFVGLFAMIIDKGKY